MKRPAQARGQEEFVTTLKAVSFADLGVPANLADALRRRGIETPFPVQAATIPDALAGRDVCGRAPTGSGKTLAFGLPLLARVAKAEPRRPRALVLAPTRELAEQIKRELVPLAGTVRRRVTAVYGGVSYHPQRSALRKGTDVLVACPGRLLDLIEQGDVQLDDVDFAVVDEADRMADMGFMPQVRRLLDMTSPQRQTLLFSATLDGEVAELTRLYQTDAARHEVGRDATDMGQARHFFWQTEAGDRVDHIVGVVSATGPTIVFTRTRHGADRLARQLGDEGISAAAIHGGRSQNQRSKALSLFSGGTVEALVATDVAARGIHVDDVACVVHYDPPADVKDYLHRSGRTARAGASGVVVSLIGRNQTRTARRMQRDLGLREDIAPADPAEIMSAQGGAVVGDVDTEGKSAKPVERKASVPRQDKPANRNRSRSGNASRGGNASGGGSGSGTGRRRRNGSTSGSRRHQASGQAGHGGGRGHHKSAGKPSTRRRSTGR